MKSRPAYLVSFVYLSLLSGQFVRPQAAIDRTFVLKVVDGRAVRVTVRKGDESAGRTQIFGDLKPGDIILKTASEELTDRSVLKTQLVNQ